MSNILLRPNLEIFACSELFEEFDRVRSYPKLLKILKPKRVAATLELMSSKAITVKIEHRTANFSDPKDNYLLDLCQTVRADFLVTGDKRLLELGFFGASKIISYSDFREKLNSI